MSADVSKSWFVVLANPEDHGYTGSPAEVCDQLKDAWIGDSTTRTGAWSYCVSSSGLRHVHMVIEDTRAHRFSAIKKTYPTAHLEPTKGSKKEAWAYLAKEYPFEEQGEQVLHITQHGIISGAQGHRSDLDAIGAMLDSGQTPDEIMDTNFRFRRYEKEIRSGYFARRRKMTPVRRDVTVHYIVGDSGSGKTQMYVDLCDKYGEESIYFVSDYENGGFDRYEGQKILFLDEFKGQIAYSKLLTILDRYKAQIHARYANVWALWEHVYITSIYPPEELYALMVPACRQETDTYYQLLRRLTEIIYCYITPFGDYERLCLPASEYKDYATLRRRCDFNQMTIVDCP